MTRPLRILIWTASSVFGTYRLCEQRRFRRACASAQSRQNLRCSLIQAVNQEEPSDRKPDPWPLWMAGHGQLKLVIPECSKTQIRLTRLIYLWRHFRTNAIRKSIWHYHVDGNNSVTRAIIENAKQYFFLNTLPFICWILTYFITLDVLLASDLNDSVVVYSNCQCSSPSCLSLTYCSIYLR